MAHTELKRLALEVSITQKQLETCAGYEELGKAVEALDEACRVIADSADHTDDEP